MLNSGDKLPGRPSMGSWLTYGLGTENQNLPGYVVLCPGLPVVGPQLWSSTFLPAVYQGTYIPNNETEPEKLIPYIRNQRADDRRAAPAAGSAGAIEPAATGARGPDPQLEATIQSMEIAFRMQTEAPEAFDIASESRGDARAVRRWRFRARLPDGAAPGRARRAHGAGLFRQRAAVGQSRRYSDPPDARGTSRPADRRAAGGSQSERTVAGDASS